MRQKKIIPITVKSKKNDQIINIEEAKNKQTANLNYLSESIRISSLFNSLRTNCGVVDELAQ